jgi:hypothetical protein
LINGYASSGTNDLSPFAWAFFSDDKEIVV